MNNAIILFAGVLAAIRIWIHGNIIDTDGLFWVEVYKAIAHVFVGGLAGAWLVRRKTAHRALDATIANQVAWWTFWLLNAVEVACVVIPR